jgi:toxin ParE1/3/4
MSIIFSPEARAEFEDGERYYEHQVAGLGARFRQDVKQALLRLRTWPLACPIERGDIRRLILSRFPYKLLYTIESDHVYILAVANTHRAPDYWVQRCNR